MAAKYGVKIDAVYTKLQAHWLQIVHLEKLLGFQHQLFQNSLWNFIRKGKETRKPNKK